MKLAFKVDNLKEGKGSVICRADLTLQAVQGNGNLLDLVTVKECGLCPSRKGGYVLLSPSRTFEKNGETCYVNLVGWPQFAYDAGTNALMNAAQEAGWLGVQAGAAGLETAKPQLQQPATGTITKAQLQQAGLVENDNDPLDPFADM